MKVDSKVKHTPRPWTIYHNVTPTLLSLSEALEEAYSRTCEAEYSTTTDTRDALPCGNKIEASQDPEVTTCKDCEDSVVL